MCDAAANSSAVAVAAAVAVAWRKTMAVQYFGSYYHDSSVAGADFPRRRRLSSLRELQQFQSQLLLALLLNLSSRFPISYWRETHALHGDALLGETPLVVVVVVRLLLSEAQSPLVADSWDCRNLSNEFVAVSVGR